MTNVRNRLGRAIGRGALLLCLALPTTVRAEALMRVYTRSSYPLEWLLRDRQGEAAEGNAVAIDEVNRIVVATTVGFDAAQHLQMGVMRFVDGARDPSFGFQGSNRTAFAEETFARRVAIDRKGRIVVMGSVMEPERRVALARFLANGRLDTDFGTGGQVLLDLPTREEEAVFLGIDEANRIVLAGSAGAHWQDRDYFVARCDERGTLDTTFGTRGGHTLFDVAPADVAAAATIDSQGRIVVVGYHTGGLVFPEAGTPILVRFGPSGTVDTSFGAGGVAWLDSSPGDMFPAAVAIANDDTIVVAGDSVSRWGWDLGSVPYLLAWDARGDRKRDFPREEYAQPTHTHVVALSIDRAGRLLLVGKNQSSTGPRFSVTRRGADGQASAYTSNRLDTTTLPAEAGVSLVALGATLDQNQSVVVVGAAYPQGQGDVAIARYRNVVPTGSFSDLCLSCSTGAPVCGNRLVEPGEECDDGATAAGDGCSPTCWIEPNRDDDELFDPIDFCVNVDGARTFLPGSASLTVRNVNTDTVPDNDRLDVEGKFQMPADWSFADFDPEAFDGEHGRGIEVHVMHLLRGTRVNGFLGYDGPTRGWVRTGTAWRYTNTTPDAGHPITSMVVRDAGAGRVRVTISARKVTFPHPISELDVPLQVAVTLGRVGGASEHGACGESRFQASDCRWNATRNRLRCRTGGQR